MLFSISLFYELGVILKIDFRAAILSAVAFRNPARYNVRNCNRMNERGTGNGTGDFIGGNYTLSWI